MTYHYIETEFANGVFTIILNRPDVHNAFNEDMILELTDAFSKAGADNAVRAVILKGNGKSFCAGGDLNWMRRTAEYSFVENVEDAGRLGKLLKTIQFIPKITIALVHGNAFGGGVGLAATCDIVIARSDAKFCLSEVRIGIIPSIIAPYVIQAIGPRQARRYFLTAERISAQTAERIGLVHEVVQDDDELLTVLNMLLQAVRDGAPTAQARGKKVIQALTNRPIDDEMIQYTVEQIAEARASAEGIEGLSAFLNKREPSWRGE